VDESEDTENEIVQADFSWDAGLVTRLVNAAALLPGDAETKAKLAAMIAGISELGGSPSLTAAMAQGRKAESPAVRACAADVLGRAQSPGAVRALSAAASDANTTVRLEVAKALAAISETQTIEPLSRLIGDPEPAVRSAAIRGLKERLTLDDSRTLYQRFLGSAATIKILIEAMTIETSDRVAERDAAAEVLGRIGKPCVDPLLAGLKSPNKFFREGAVSALGATGVDEAVAAVLEFGGEATVRADGAMMARLYEALGAGKNRRAFDALVDGLRSPAAGARAAAARALGALGDIRAVDALIEARTGADGDLGQAIVEALEVLTKITPEESNFDWKTWWLKNRTNYLGKKSA
jgi:HEAT repeat protein